jgi:glycosyltransferase involved in cell wall biosynthesis
MPEESERSMRTLTVVCPVYNEEEVIARFHAELWRVLETVTDRWQPSVLYVVDRCTDRTIEVLKGIAASESSVQILALSARFGHQMSLLAGLDHCDSDAVLMMDCDLQHPPSLVPELLAGFEQGYDIVYTVREDSPEVPAWKRLSSRGFYRLVNSISDTPINESAADFRIVSRRVVELFQTRIRERNQFLRGLFGWIGFPSLAVRFKVGRRLAGETKYSVRRMVRFGLDGVVSFSKTPLQAAVYLGFSFGALGFLYACVTLVQFLLYRSFPSGWATIIILISIFNGTQLVFLGILGEYLGAVFDEVKARPHYIVEERINLAVGPGGVSNSSGKRGVA